MVPLKLDQFYFSFRHMTVCAGGKLHISGEGNTLREEGLQKAIDAAGGVAALARILGIAQPSVSGWTRVPADRVAAIESATGVARADLRPDLFAREGEVSTPMVDEIDLLRASEYGLLAVLLGKAPMRPSSRSSQPCAAIQLKWVSPVWLLAMQRPKLTKRQCSASILTFS